MSLYRIQIKPLTAFGSPLLGDMLFGQMCCAIAEQQGKDRLRELLDGYQDGHPFCVISDAFPAGFLPLPSLPSFFWNLPSGQAQGEQDQAGAEYAAIRKELKKKIWLPVQELCKGKVDPKDWRNQAKTEKDLFFGLKMAADQIYPATYTEAEKQALTQLQMKPGQLRSEVRGPHVVKAITAYDVVMHNTISRITSTTGEDEFAPYTMTNLWYRKGQLLDLYVVLGESGQGFSLGELHDALDYVGRTGFGRDASVGLGKFELAVRDRDDFCALKPVGSADGLAKLLEPSETKMTLASSVLSGQPEIVQGRTFYRARTHFGRHGGVSAIQGAPFKSPILLASRGAVVSFRQKCDGLIVGRGISGISNVQPETVHQGYSPVVSIPEINLSPVVSTPEVNLEK